MLRKRILFALIYSDGFFMQSRNFRLQKVGDLSWLEKNYQFQKIAFSLDELIVLNATKGDKDMPSFAKVISELVHDVFIPICAGGGIRSMEHAELLFANGADKIILNSLFTENPSVVRSIIKRYGSQSVVASVDYKLKDGSVSMYTNDGTRRLDSTLPDYLRYLEELNVGEIYLNSIDKDGTGFGYDFDTIDSISESLSMPLIIAGGAGNEKHLVDGLMRDGVNAVATANLFNFIGDGIPKARKIILEKGLNIAKWD